MTDGFQNEVPNARINIKFGFRSCRASKKTELPGKLMAAGYLSNSPKFAPLSAREKANVNKIKFDVVLSEYSQKKLSQVSKRLHSHYDLTTQIDGSLYDTLTAACLLSDTCARNVDSLLNQQILPALSQQLLTHMAARQQPQSLCLSWNEEEGIGLEFDRTQGVHA